MTTKSDSLLFLTILQSVGAMRRDDMRRLFRGKDTESYGEMISSLRRHRLIFETPDRLFYHAYYPYWFRFSPTISRLMAEYLLENKNRFVTLAPGTRPVLLRTLQKDGTNEEILALTSLTSKSVAEHLRKPDKFVHHTILVDDPSLLELLPITGEQYGCIVLGNCDHVVSFPYEVLPLESAEKEGE